MNGFQKCGLYPFNADAIHYSQLLKKGKLNDSQQNNDDPLPPKEIVNPFLKQFESHMDANKLTEFKKSVPKWQGDICDVSLYKYWRKIGGSINPDNNRNTIQLCGGDDIIFEYIDASYIKYIHLQCS